MLAIDVMTRPVLTIRVDDSVEQAAALLAHKNVTAAPVVDLEGDLVGIVSEGDLLRARVAYTPDAAYMPLDDRRHARTVAAVMTRDVVVLTTKADLAEIAEAMLRYNVHSIPIVDDTAELAGIVCRHDLLRAYVRTDDVIQWDVQHRLDQYAGGDRMWDVTVHEGVVEITGDYVDDVERKVVEVLARSVAGVVDIRSGIDHGYARLPADRRSS
jgi:CBS-domain-containing membrane protein